MIDSDFNQTIGNLHTNGWNCTNWPITTGQFYWGFLKVFFVLQA